MLDQNSSFPSVSIGLPVFNGEPHIQDAIDSLLGQTYPNFELIVSDNGSTDRTAEICSAYAIRDPRVRFFRNDTNIGGAKNFNRVFDLSCGKYFAWAAHDDLWHPSYIAKCVNVLEEHPEYVLCASNIRFIDDRGSPLEHPGRFNRMNTSSMGLRERTRTLTAEVNWYALYGVMSAEMLRKTRLVRSAFGGDVVLLMEILFQGETFILNEPLFTYRLIAKTVDQHIKELTGVKAEMEVPAYTGLARDLLAVIDASSAPSALKQCMRDDLLENVSFRNGSWRGEIMRENPGLQRVVSYLVPIEICALLVPDMSPSELAKLRRRAYEGFIAQLPLKDRAVHKVKRLYDRHIGWRLRA